jgi:hypothetical protein
LGEENHRLSGDVNELMKHSKFLISIEADNELLRILCRHVGNAPIQSGFILDKLKLTD